MPRLPRFTRGTAPTSRRTADRRCGRTAALNRMPSGRCTASTLITSAPIAASHAVANGPAQNAVKSSTRTPASGRSPDRVRRLRARGACHAAHGVPASRGATQLAVGARRGSGTARAAGSTPRRAAGTNTSRATSCSNARELGAVADDRRRHARLDARVRRSRRRCARASSACSASFTSSARSKRPIIVPSSSSSAMSSRPITPRERMPLRLGDGRDADVAPVAGRLVARDHHPAERCQPAAGKARHQRRHGHERHLDRFEHRHVDGLGDTGARRAPPRGRRAERGERAGDVLAEVAADGQRRPVRVTVRREAAAARLQHFFGEIEAVVGTAVTERGDRDGDERIAAAATCPVRRRSRCRRPRATAPGRPRGAATCAGT